MTMNILLSNEQQVLFAENWPEKMNIGLIHSGNDMGEKEIALISSEIDTNALLAYRTAVGKQTRHSCIFLATWAHKCNEMGWNNGILSFCCGCTKRIR